MSNWVLITATAIALLIIFTAWCLGGKERIRYLATVWCIIAIGGIWLISGIEGSIVILAKIPNGANETHVRSALDQTLAESNITALIHSNNYGSIKPREVVNMINTNMIDSQLGIVMLSIDTPRISRQKYRDLEALSVVIQNNLERKLHMDLNRSNP